MAVLEHGEIQIHTENIFPIIKKAVYSGHEVFLRELVSNGVDAVNKRRMAAMAGDCQEGEDGEIQVRIDREAKTITVSDNGIGMDADEVKRYINQVAFSSAEEFLSKYKHEQDAIIGHFGLGFYSSFMVASKVELRSLSAKPGARAVRWSCDGSPRFQLEEGDRSTPGTDVILHLQEEELEYREPSRIRQLITTYCDFMPVPVKLEGETVNRCKAPWRQSPSELKDEDYRELYRYLYPFQGDPLLWVHLSTDYPYNLRGILFFPKLQENSQWDQGQIRLYCNQVFVSDSVKEVVPSFLLPLKGVLDAPDLPLNVSRSALQTDRRVRSIGGFIARKVGDRLAQLHGEEPQRYGAIWNDLAPFIKIGAMEEEKFADKVADRVLFATTAQPAEGQADPIATDAGCYTTVKRYLERCPEERRKSVIYCTDPVAQGAALQLWTSQGIEVLTADALIDSQFLPWLEQREEQVGFKRVDAELDESFTDQTPELADASGEDEGERLRSLFKAALNNDKITVQVKSLKGEAAPAALILLPEQMRRINDVSALMQRQLPSLPDHHVLLINKTHPLVKGLLKLAAGSVVVGSGPSPNTTLSHEICCHLHQLAQLGVGGLKAEQLLTLQTRSQDLLGRLLARLD
ncbi:MAG: molecular chaperone HtpG [Synechococcus sp. SB0669_bin_7]|nr:molecular chaperone HtpG [Cyanobacteria bacterium MAG IRC4_bin_6]MYK06260.1 molecular chaperone HtpG [Synechococcus sp. SB0670_bin_20]MYK85418.1 molecular chaperone HtpG [Synechococcus sp. SB0669_bin_7]